MQPAVAKDTALVLLSVGLSAVLGASSAPDWARYLGFVAGGGLSAWAGWQLWLGRRYASERDRITGELRTLIAEGRVLTDSLLGSVGRDEEGIIYEGTAFAWIERTF